MKMKITLDNLPSNISIEAAQEFLDYRQAMPKDKRLNTQRAFDRQMKSALRSHEVGMTPDELIEFTIDRSWRGINVSYTKNWIAQNMKAEMNAYQITSGSQRTRDSNMLENLNDDSWAN